ncbi:MAG: futalosine hydrolase [Planctomycetota bacterium]
MLLVCVASEVEGAVIRRRLGGARGEIAGKRVGLLVTGVGPVNAAHALTLSIALEAPRSVLVCGVGGAYPGMGLEPLDVACARTEIYGDLGAESPDGFLDMEALGLPVVRDLFNRLPLSLFPAERSLPFVTRTTCTGTEAAAREMVARTGGAVESMEGAAVVHVALEHDLEVGEVRAISNRVGDRDRASWKVSEAAGLAQAALLDWIEAC